MKYVAYHQLAAKELIESASFYEQRREFLGEEFLEEVDLAVEAILKNPNFGRFGKSNTLSQRMKRFPFRIIYRVQPERIWIVAVAHLARMPGYWANRVQ